MNKQEIIEKTAKIIKEKMAGEGTGHDWWHVCRVWKTAEHIAQEEEADLFIVELGALLHDVADWKFHEEGAGPKEARKILEQVSTDRETIEKVVHVVENVSFKGAGEENKIQSLEGKIVQDADRLDAIGAIGITRAFAYGGYKNREIYNPEVTPEQHATFEQYKNNKGTTINHFYEKLLLLKDRMNTQTAKKMAEHRHKYMEDFLQEFYAEWEGKK
ncbi:MAG: HD domain-containing protein [Candidatus Micrarchaeota archaeon]